MGAPNASLPAEPPGALAGSLARSGEAAGLSASRPGSPHPDGGAEGSSAPHGAQLGLRLLGEASSALTHDLLLFLEGEGKKKGLVPCLPPHKPLF